MSALLIGFIAVSVAFSALDAILSVSSFKKRTSVGNALGVLFCACCAINLLYIGRVCTGNLALHSLLTAVYFVGVDVMLVAMTFFVAFLVELKDSPMVAAVRKGILVLAGIDILGFITNPLTGFWLGFTHRDAAFSVFAQDPQLPFQGHMVLSYVLVVLCIALLVRKWRIVEPDYKRKYGYATSGLLAVVFFSVISFIFPKFLGSDLLDYSALACSFAALVFYWSAFLFSTVRFMYNHSVPLERRMNVLFVVSGFIASLCGLLICLAASVSYVGILTVGAVLVVMVATSLAAKRLGRVELSRWILIAGVLVAMPTIWLFAGGINSGVNIWLVYELFYIAFALKGRSMYVALSLAIVLDGACYVFSYYNPQYVFVLKDSLDTYISVVGSALVVGITVVFTVLYQKNIYYDEQAILEKSYEERKRLQLEAENANKAKGDFLASMSHEIRTPINAVLGMDEMILRGGTPEEIKEYATNIKQAGNILLALINDVLDFSKIESGKMDIIPVEYKLSSVLNDLVSMILPRASDKGLELKTDFDENLPSVLFGDDMRLRQIITNLLTNAVKYTPKGSVTLKVRGHEVSGAYALDVSVKDTGIGIRDEDRSRLFESFRRLDETRNRGIEGTGLGLSITIKLLNLMGSSLNLKSVYGEGSDFHFELKQGIVDRRPMGNLQHNLEDSARQVPVFHESFEAPEARILVVDDNRMNLMVVKGLLKQSRMQIDTAMSGEESLNKVEQNRYDLIFMDHMMPNMDGIEAVRRMKELKTNLSKDAKIIALTANAMSGAREMYLAAGMDDFLSKPIRGSQLEKVILQYLPAALIRKKA